jgi:hypothetical protein
LRVENLGFLASFTRFAVVAKLSLLVETLLATSLLTTCWALGASMRRSQLRLYEKNLRPERHSHMLQQRPRLIVVLGRGHNCYVHALQLIDLHVIDFREN